MLKHMKNLSVAVIGIFIGITLFFGYQYVKQNKFIIISVQDVNYTQQVDLD
jgi:hypothetical protein